MQQRILKKNPLDDRFLRSLGKLRLGIKILKEEMKGTNFPAILKRRNDLRQACYEYEKVSKESPNDDIHNLAKARGVTFLVEADSLCKECSKDMRLFFEVVR